WQRDLLFSHSNLGDLMTATGNLPEAEKHCRNALEIIETLAARDKSNADWQRDLSVSHERLGDFLKATGNLPEAEKHYRNALEIRETLAARDKSNADWQRDLSVSHSNLGDLMKATGNLPEAEKHYRNALEIRETLAARDKSNTDRQRDLCISYERMGLLTKQRKQWAEASDWLGKAQKLAERLFVGSQLAEAAKFQANILQPLIVCCVNLKDYEAALGYQKKLTDLLRRGDDKAELANALVIQGNLEGQLGKHADAYRSLSEAESIASSLTDIEPNKASGLNSSICWSALLSGAFPEALAAGEKAVARLSDEKPCPARMNLAHACLLNGQFEKAKAIYSKYRGQAFEDGRKWNEEIRNDIKALRAAGHDHPDMKKIETLMQEADETKP
ncbi:MAG: tetratricopeptide repeat protein, partial [Candidatus Sumerlaeota bacterium]|nr:tetratricopeptide repeat protein [Candidatus Sumerlaeota bacterium]